MQIRTISATAAVALTATLAATLALAACSPSTAPARPAKPVMMTDCNGLRHARPQIVNVVCESDAITARSLTWSAWGAPAATAIGTAVVDVCAWEDCHTASYSAYPIVVIASKIVKCAKGRPVYSRLQYDFVGRSPFAGLPKNLGIANSMVGSHRPGPPHDETVTLPC